MPTSELEGHLGEAPAAGVAPLRAQVPADAALRRAVLAGPVVAVVALAAAAVATRAAGLPLRDPGAVTVRRLGVAAAVVAGLILADLLARAVARRRGVPSLRDVAALWRERWTGVRLGAVALALVAFHVTYLAYRNIKSVAPLLRPGDLFDRQLADVDRWLFAGRDPAALLHDLLGTGVAAHSLSSVYMLFFALIPVALGVGLVLLADLRAGLFVATALSLTWILGAGSYLVFPSIGPFHHEAAAFASLPRTPVHELQDSLMARRAAFLAAPSAPGAAQSVGAFASLHTAILGTVVIAAHLLAVPRAVRVAVWALAVLTVLATVYFGWHYVLDDVAGVLIAALAVVVAVWLTRPPWRPAR